MKGVDWQEETFNPTWSQDHNLSISGGSDNTKYTASFSRYIEMVFLRIVDLIKRQVKFALIKR